MSGRRLLVVLVIVALVATFFALNLDRYISLDYLKSQQEEIAAYYRLHPLETAAVYFAIYVVVTGLSLPGAAILTLAGGVIFGLVWGTVIVSFASTIGATLAFLASRFLLRDWVQRKFGESFEAGERRRGARGRLLPLRAAAGAGVPLRRHQPRDGVDADAHVDLSRG